MYMCIDINLKNQTDVVILLNTNVDLLRFKN